MPSSKTYQVDNIDALSSKIETMGGLRIDPSIPHGEASTNGVTLSWIIANNSITVSIVKRPWFIPESTIWSHIDGLFS